MLQAAGIDEDGLEYLIANPVSMINRYASHNDYIGFKRLLHDANHPGTNAPPLPNPATWFPSSTSPDPSQSNPTSGNRAQNPADDDESDIEVASERISIKCPLTLLPMKEPYTSRKCPHSFEKEAILEMIQTSGTFLGSGGKRAGVEKSVMCPVCEVVRYSDPDLCHTF